MAEKTQLPPQFWKYFWEIAPQQLDLDQYHQYVVLRLLRYGDIEAIKWLQDRFGIELIKDALRHGRDLNRKQGIFYAHIYNLPLEEVKCLSKAFPLSPDRIWPY